MGGLEAVLADFGIDGQSYSVEKAEDGRFSTSACALIAIKGIHIGRAGEVGARALNNFDIKDKVYALEIDMSAFTQRAALEKRFKGLPKYPSVTRDISLA